MTDDRIYDLAVTGGGLAGLAVSILSARKGHSVILFEKEKYPFHRVCGEYISRESWDFLQGLGLDLPSMNVSAIDKLQVSSINGKLLQQRLPLGGFGISRYKLDHVLARIAEKEGVQLREQTTVNDTYFTGEGFELVTTAGSFRSRMVVGSYGKRGKLDIKWKRPFIMAKKNKLNNYIGVKYHVRSSFPTDTIALHLFPKGYCGISKVEDDKYNLCYLTTAANLQQCGGDPNKMEKEILSRNPYLGKIFSEAEKLMDQPVIISQISFDKKTQVEDHVLMIGDAAGMITPLCGNGMSMALHAAKIAAEQIDLFLKGSISRDEMERNYRQQWRHLFAGRLRMGRRLQRLFGNKWLTDSLISLGKLFPGISRMLIRGTHGKNF